MRVPLTWLRDYVALAVPPEELAATLAVTSCEVERISYRGVPDEGGNHGLYRVGRVLEAGKHPNADRLQLCQVDVGEAEPRQVVCGAWNFGAGATVPVALPGSLLPDGRRLERAKLRGSVSDGMILSERELELGGDHAGIMLLEDGLQPGTPLGDLFPLGEQVLEVEVTGNRPDLLSMTGFAREVGAVFGLELAPFPGREPERAGDEAVDVRVDDPGGCPVYLARVFRDVRIGPSPPWLKARLVAAGMRPISNVVDVTNYVMHVFGSPLHAFDRAKLAEGRIVVRRAGAGEEVVTLDGNRRALVPDDLVIADASRPVAVAAIMGGLDTEVDDATSEVLLEAANFEPVTILRTSERLGLRTEGSNRWEKGVDPHAAGPAAVLASQLIVELAGGRWVGGADVRAELPAPAVLRLRPARADALIGVRTPPQRQREILAGLGFALQGDAEGPAWQVTVPTWRARDVTREVDLVEEVARFELESVPFTLPARRELFGRLTPAQRLRREVEDVLLGCGLDETYTPSLVRADESPGALVLPQPLSQEHAALRTSLLPSLVRAVGNNLDAGAEHVDLFEVARVYLPGSGELPDESWHVGGVVRGGFGRAKGVVETLLAALHVADTWQRTREPFLHPGKAAAITAGWVGELHPSLLRGWSAFELDLGLLLAAAPGAVQYEDVVTFPALRQDLAVVVAEEVAAGDLAEAAREAAGEQLTAIVPFDLYRGEQVGEGRKSVAFRLVFRSAQGTLTDADAAALRGRIVVELGSRFGAELRG